MKRILFTLLVLWVMGSANVLAADVIERILVLNDSVVIDGSSDVTYANVSLVVMPKGAEKVIENVTVVKETVSDAQRAFHLSIKTNGSPLWKDGFYTLNMRIGETEVTQDFYYYSQSGKDSVIRSFINNPEQRSGMLNPSETTYQTFLAMGLPLDRLPAGGKTEFLSVVQNALTSDMEEADFCTQLKRSIAAVLLNQGTKEQAGSALLLGEFDYDKESNEVRDWMSGALYENRPYSHVADFETSYRQCRALYDLNDTKYSDLTALIQEHAELMGLTGLAEYRTFQSMSSVKQSNVCEALVLTISKKTTMTAKAFRSAFQSAVNFVNTGNNSGGKPSGNGGGNDRSGVVVTPVQTAEEPAPDTGSEPFSDLSSVLWAEKAIVALYHKQYVSGVGEGLFEPNRPITREEFVTMLVKISGTANSYMTIPFEDVRPTDWFFSYIQTAYECGMIKGITETQFGAGTWVSRQDMAVMTMRGYRAELPEGQEKPDFTDQEEIADYAVESVQRLYQAGIISGMGDGRFSPNSTTTRAEAAVLLYRMFGEGN